MLQIYVAQIQFIPSKLVEYVPILFKYRMVKYGQVQ